MSCAQDWKKFFLICAFFWLFFAQISPTLEGLQKRFTTNQKEALLKCFKAKHHLEPEEEHQLAQSLNISEKRIKRWFYRYRAMQDGQLCEGEESWVNHAIINTYMYFGMCNTQRTQASTHTWGAQTHPHMHTPTHNSHSLPHTFTHAQSCMRTSHKQYTQPNIHTYTHTHAHTHTTKTIISSGYFKNSYWKYRRWIKFGGLGVGSWTAKLYSANI